MIKSEMLEMPVFEKSSTGLDTDKEILSDRKRQHDCQGQILPPVESRSCDIHVILCNNNKKTIKTLPRGVIDG